MIGRIITEVTCLLFLTLMYQIFAPPVSILYIQTEGQVCINIPYLNVAKKVMMLLIEDGDSRLEALEHYLIAKI